MPAKAHAWACYGTIRISRKLALELAASELIEWTLVGTMVGLIYKPAKAG